jgi:hypothetical protein
MSDVLHQAEREAEQQDGFDPPSPAESAQASATSSVGRDAILARIG